MNEREEEGEGRRKHGKTEEERDKGMGRRREGKERVGGEGGTERREGLVGGKEERGE